MNSEPNNLFKRRGKVVITRYFLTNAEEQVLNALFSNFYPIAIENNHDYGMYDSLTYFGYSPLFEEVEEGIICPQYEITFRSKTGENNITETILEKVEKVKDIFHTVTSEDLLDKTKVIIGRK